ncbi:MAG: OmpA family protein [Myxococcales bacterium]|nr:OmpA family protein [Myxococcales bacterium]
MRTSKQSLWMTAVIAAGVLATAMPAASAQVVDEAADFSVERYRLAADKLGILTAESADIPYRGYWDVSAWFGYANDPLVLYRIVDGERVRQGSLVSERFGGELGLSYAVHARLQAFAALGLIGTTNRFASNPAVVGELDDISGFGLGDTRLGLKAQLLKGGLNLAILGEGVIGTGGGEAYRGERDWALSPALLASFGAGPLRFSLNLGYIMRKQSTVADLVVDDEVFGRAAVALGLGRARALELQAGVQLGSAKDEFFSRVSSDPAEVLFGLAYNVGRKQRAQIFATGGVGLNEGYGTPDWRALGGVRIGAGLADAPAKAKDTDGDGISDPNDACINDKEDADKFEDDDGCPEADNDKDGILDGDDKCPNEPETVNQVADEDGCPDVGDRDRDGLADDTDKCPDEAEDFDGFEDENGCPDLDNDKDGVADTADKCPMEPGPVENNGCPDTDGDGDGVVDRLDNCPNEPGPKENQGCKAKQQVVITDTGLQILDIVYFKTNSDVILKKSYPLLNNVAAVINAQTRIAKIRVEGHTDSQGDDESNLDLSQRRADSVKAYLIQKGVAAERLQGQGFGETMPVDSNDTKAGRAKNRRVEFKIVN